ncbi:MAG: Fic family protein [Paludibacteraceae bacterium]|nr:Fic family protein [Paludibacteraceae bacterium]
METKQPYFNFDEYIRQGEPDAAASAEQWQTAMGLQAVDGLKPSQYLIDTARRNIEGEITIDEVQDLLRSYYASEANRSVTGEDAEEADKAAANIKRILSTQTLAFNTNGFLSTHRRIFDGVMKHAGELRKYDITKKEWVLRGDTVNYLNWEDLRRAIDYDIQQEKAFSYKGLSDIEKVRHLCYFTADLWQIHAFPEGNTRTTAVFLIQYLRSIGYKVNNDMFAKHSWYFRNALVRANYKNSALGIDYDYQYLERFFRNLLLGENNELKNRHLVINAPDNWNETQKTATVACDGSFEVVLGKLGEKAKKLGKKLGKNKIGILQLIYDNPNISTTQMSEKIGISTTAIDNNIRQMRDVFIKHIGPHKGGRWEIIMDNEL